MLHLPGYADFQVVARSEGSVVYRARQLGVDRPVAIKVLLLVDAESLARFRREIDITVRLGRQHPHIVTVLDTAVTPTGEPCIVMEHYDRGSLYDRMRAEGPLPAADVIASGLVVADALAFAHGHGVLHRDIKPQNILVLPTSYVLADFGIARPMNAAYTTSVEWFSYHHASPQVLDGEPPTVADDIWSMGSTLFTLLDGWSPFSTFDPRQDTALAYMRRVRTGDARPLRRDDLPDGLAEVIDRCLRRDPAQRYRDAAGLRDALAAIGSARPAPATGRRSRRTTHPATPAEETALLPVIADDKPSRPTGPRPSRPGLRAPRPVSRYRRLLVWAGVAVVLGTALGVGVRWFTGRPDPQSSAATPTPSEVTNPALAPAITAVEVRGDGIVLRWQDRTGGRATFIVVRVTDGPPEPVDALPPGTTTYVVDGVDPAKAPHCFVVIALVGNERGFSPSRCADGA
jgi:serine/threonine protein kinase